MTKCGVFSRKSVILMCSYLRLLSELNGVDNTRLVRRHIEKQTQFQTTPYIYWYSGRSGIRLHPMLNSLQTGQVYLTRVICLFVTVDVFVVRLLWFWLSVSFLASSLPQLYFSLIKSTMYRAEDYKGGTERPIQKGEKENECRTPVVAKRKTEGWDRQKN